MRYLLYSICLLSLFACSNAEEEKLRAAVKEELTVEAKDSLSLLDAVTLEQYKELELKFNKQYISNLRNIIDNGFDVQLEKFDDEELGFWASYGYMWDFFFKSQQEWEDELLLKSNKYFSSLNIEQQAGALFEDYITDITALRGKFVESQGQQKNHVFQSLNLPEKDINMMAIKEHARNNILIEISEEFLEWLLGLAIGALLCLLLGKVTKYISLIPMAICILVSWYMSRVNDDKLLDSLKEQKSKYHVDYDPIVNSLNENTISFYENKE